MAPASCTGVDAGTKLWTLLRLFTVGGYVLYKVLQKKTEERNIFKKVFFNGLKFIEHEGLAMTVYFVMAFVLDMTTVFLVTVKGYCEAEKLVTIYMVATLTFIPNVFYTRCLQEAYFEKGSSSSRCLFVLGAMALCAASFWVRLQVVFTMGFIDFVARWTEGLPVFLRTMLAGLVPPAVDLLQSVILTLFSPQPADAAVSCREPEMEAAGGARGNYKLLPGETTKIASEGGSSRTRDCSFGCSAM